jgi:signal transduction histidine kinase
MLSLTIEMPLNEFLFGLASFTMGLIVLLRGRGDSEIALGRQFRWLGAYGLLTSVVGWGFAHQNDAMNPQPLDLSSILFLMALIGSGVVLVRFGSGLIVDAGPLPIWLGLLPIALLIPAALLVTYGIVVMSTASDSRSSIIQWSSFLLLMPGGILASLGFIRQWSRLKQIDHVPASGILLLTAAAFLINALFCAIVSEKTALDSTHIVTVTGVTIETWRLLLMVVIAVLVTGSMNVFEIERRRHIDRLEAARREAQRIALSIHTRTRQEAEIWLDALVKIGQRIAGMDAADDILRDVVTRASEILAADAAVIALYEPNGLLSYKVQFVSGSAQVVASSAVESKIILEAVSKVTPLRYPDDIGGGAFEWRANGQITTAESAAIVPLQSNKTLIGALWLGRTDGRPFTCTDLIGLGYVANQVVVALEHMSMAAGLQSLAVIEERSRIAREMHDSLAQILGYLGLESHTLEALVLQGDQEAILEELRMARESIKSAQADVRENILSLRTALAGDTGLITALKKYVEEFGLQNGIATVIEDRAGENVVVPPLAETQCVRVVQEALTNVRKHAHAKHVRVAFTALPDRLDISIADDGVGMNPGIVTHGHFGLQTMSERIESVGGELTVTSRPGRGTTVSFGIPLSYQTVRTEAHVTFASASG